MRRRRLIAPCLLLLLALSACASGEPSGDAIDGDPSASATATASPTATASNARPSPGSTAAASPTSAAPSPTGSAIPPARAAVTRATPPAAGTYRYAQHGSFTYAGFTFADPAEGTLTVERDSAAAGGRRQESTRRYSERRSREQTLLFRSDGVYLERATTRFGEGPAAREYACEPAKPMRILPAPLGVGDDWRASGTCDGITIEFAGRVLRAESRTVGGTKVDTLVMRVVTEASGEGVQQTSTATIWLATKQRLIVRTEEESSGSMQGATFTGSTVEDLLSLEPR